MGDPAPDFELKDQSGQLHSIEDYRGKWVALYFYPKDDTPGCTTEACEFRDNIFAFKNLNCQILGVSLDDVDSHKEFAEKYSLPFPLLADTAGTTADAYGVKSLCESGPGLALAAGTRRP
jgi:peroxiredoxin Q/BCP